MRVLAFLIMSALSTNAAAATSCDKAYEVGGMEPSAEKPPIFDDYGRLVLDALSKKKDPMAIFAKVLQKNDPKVVHSTDHSKGADADVYTVNIPDHSYVIKVFHGSHGVTSVSETIDTVSTTFNFDYSGGTCVFKDYAISKVADGKETGFSYASKPVCDEVAPINQALLAKLVEAQRIDGLLNYYDLALSRSQVSHDVVQKMIPGKAWILHGIDEKVLINKNTFGSPSNDLVNALNLFDVNKVRATLFLATFKKYPTVAKDPNDIPALDKLFGETYSEDGKTDVAKEKVLLRALDQEGASNANVANAVRVTFQDLFIRNAVCQDLGFLEEGIAPDSAPAAPAGPAVPLPKAPPADLRTL